MATGLACMPYRVEIMRMIGTSLLGKDTHSIQMYTLHNKYVILRGDIVDKGRSSHADTGYNYITN